MLKNHSGMSMIEFILVCAIITVMGSIGITKYEKFRNKARRSEAKVALAGLYTAEKSFHEEWHHYTIDLKNAGFAVQGTNLRYQTGFGGPHGSTCYANDGVKPNENAGYRHTAKTEVNTSGATFTENINNFFDNSSFPLQCTATTFTGLSLGNPTSDSITIGSQADVWSIDESKKLSNTNSFY